MKDKNNFRHLNIWEGIICGAIFGFGVGTIFLGFWEAMVVCTVIGAICGILLIFLDLEWFFKMKERFEKGRIG